MIDTDTIEKYILGGEWENQYPQVIEYLLAEVKRLRYHLDLMIEKFGEAYLIETLIERGEEE